MTATTTIPNPATVFGARKAAPQLAAPVDTTAPAAPHDPTKHDGVVKSKHLKKGQVVRAWNSEHGPRGGERTVESIERLGDGAMVRVHWSSAHAPSEHKAAYRWFDAALAGTSLPKPRRPRRKLTPAPAPMTSAIGDALGAETRVAIAAIVEA